MHRQFIVLNFIFLHFICLRLLICSDFLVFQTFLCKCLWDSCKATVFQFCHLSILFGRLSNSFCQKFASMCGIYSFHQSSLDRSISAMHMVWNFILDPEDTYSQIPSFNRKHDFQSCFEIKFLNYASSFNLEFLDSTCSKMMKHILLVSLFSFTVNSSFWHQY